jgi:diguanylate cyclase (GGDEF)-like protein
MGGQGMTVVPPHRNVLIVDDDPTFCDVLRAQLEQLDYRVSTETDARLALSRLQEGDFDVLLLDLMMPEIGGLDVLEEIRQHFSVLPIVVVTGYDIPEATVDAMRRGATDFVTKPVDISFLDLRIHRACEHELARRLANSDGLTGLYNHRYLQERLQHEVERARRYSRSLSLVMADIDHFKRYNDRWGHPRGDEVLMAVARVLRRVSRGSDIAARYGGEEFTLVLPETSLEAAAKVAERTRRTVAGLRFEGARVTLSLGVSTLLSGDSKEALIENADRALYQAKRDGRNRVRTAPVEVELEAEEDDDSEVEPLVATAAG